MLVDVPGERTHALEDPPGDLGRSGVTLLLAEETRRDSAAVLDAVVMTVAGIVEARGVRRVFATGGDTAYALCRRLGVESLRFFAELEPGLTIAGGRGAGGDEWLLGVKPGGFGGRETWVKAWSALLQAGTGIGA